MDDDTRFRLLRLLQDEPNISQRNIAKRLGISLGAANYVLRALVEKGQVKVKNFRAADNKLRYAYVLTPSGIMERMTLTTSFLRRKMNEYEILKAEIEALQAEVADHPDGAIREAGE